MQFAGVMVKLFAHPGDKEVLLSQGIDSVTTSGSFDIPAGQWIAYSLLTEDTEDRTVCDVYIFEKASRKVVIVFLGFTFIRKSAPVSQRLRHSVESAGLGSKTAAAASAGNLPVLDVQPVSIADSGTSVTSASRASNVL